MVTVETLPEWAQAFVTLAISSGVTSYVFLAAKRRGRPPSEREKFSPEKAGITFGVAFVLSLVMFALGIATNQAEAIPLLTLFAGPIAVSVQKMVDNYQRTGTVDTDPLTSTLEGLIIEVVERVLQRQLNDPKSSLTVDDVSENDSP